MELKQETGELVFIFVMANPISAIDAHSVKMQEGKLEDLRKTYGSKLDL